MQIKLVSVIVPAFKQENTIVKDLRRIKGVLDKLRYSDKKICAAIMEKIDELAVNQLPNSCKKLVGQNNLYRIRIDKYRIIYSFDDKFVHIHHIAIPNLIQNSELMTRIFEEKLRQKM